MQVGVRLLVDGYNIEGVCEARPDGTCEKAGHDVERGLLLLILFLLPDVARLEVSHHVLINGELR